MMDNSGDCIIIQYSCPPEMRKKQVTILELAARLSLSPSTVSRALNGKHRIAPETQARVKRLAKELGYRPNVSARHLRENRTYTLGVMLPSLETKLHTMLLEAFVQHARSLEHHILLQIGEEQEILHFLLNNHIDGIFLFPTSQSQALQLLGDIRSRFLPVVVIGPGTLEASQVWIRTADKHAGLPTVIAQVVEGAFTLLFDEMELIEADKPLDFQTLIY